MVTAMTGAATHGRQADPVLEGSGVKGIALASAAVALPAHGMRTFGDLREHGDASPLPAGEQAVACFLAGWDHEARRSTLGAA